MSEGEGLNKNDENEDIYKDIGDFYFDKELVKLEESNKAYSEDVKKLTAKVKQVTEKNTELQSINDILATNISILLKTAKAEIQRKQLVIDELRKKTNGANWRNYNKEDDEKYLGICKICGSKLSKDNAYEPEDGEITKKESDKDDVRSEVESHRNHKSKDKRDHSGNRKKKKKSHDRSRGRSSDKFSSHSHRSSRRSKDRHSHRSRSPRSRTRHNSPDERRQYSRRKRSRERRSHSSDYVYKSGSQKREHVSRSRETSRRSEERRRSRRSRDRESYDRVNSPRPNSSEKSEKNPGKAESSSRPVSGRLSENKTNVVRPDSNVAKSRSEWEHGKAEIEKSEGSKNLNTNNCHERVSGNSGDHSGVAKESENNLVTRQSVLADLYDETVFCGKVRDAQRPKDPPVVSGYDNEAPNFVDTSGDESWSLSFTNKKKSLVPEKPKTLYSRRMEIRLKQKLKEEEMDSAGKCDENDCAKQDKLSEVKPVCAEEEKEEGEITFEKDSDEEVAEGVIRKDEVNENVGETPSASENKEVQDKLLVDKPCADVDAKPEKPKPSPADKESEQSFGDSIVKKIVELQNQENTSGIKEFSPLKHNYKLSKISPLKSVQKQHILEYYNLKPAHQLNNIEPEILDFSFTVPETPGKNFSNPFGDGPEPVRDDEGDKPNIFKEDQCETNLNTSKDGEVSKESDSVEVVETPDGSKSEKEEKGCSPEGKQLRKTRAKRKLKPDAAKEKQTDAIDVTPKSKKNKDTVTYQIRTRSRAGNENRKPTGELNDVTERRGRAQNRNKSVPGKRKRGAGTSEEEAEVEQKHAKKKANGGAEMELTKRSNEKNTENEKGSGEPKTEGTTKASDIAHFEVFQSVSEAAGDATAKEKNPLEELSLSNMSDGRATNTSCSDTPNKLKSANESKLSSWSAGNSGDSSTFKVLRSYLMLSANGESDVEAFDDDNTSSSGDYSDSGASAFVDLL